MKGSLHMKKLFGTSILSAMLILGQPLMAFADTTDSKVVNFEDLKSIITEQNIEAQINENERLKTHAGYSGLKRDIDDLEDELDDIDNQRDQLRASGAATTGVLIPLSAEKRLLLEALKKAERTQVDRPTLEAMTDLKASMSDDAQVRTAESIFVGYNQLKLAVSDISSAIDTMQDQLFAMQLQESLGMVSHNSLNQLNTSLADMQTKLKSKKFQQDSLERQLRNLLNDQENTLVIGSVPTTDEEFTVEDEEADLKKAQENSYSIKLQEQQIVSLENTLNRTNKDNGMSSNKYKIANYELINANLKLTMMKDTLKSDYYTMLDDITKMQSDLRLAEQNLEDKRVALSEANVKMSVGMISQLERDKAIADYDVQRNAVKAKQIDLFNAKQGYEWFLNGMPWSS